MRRYLENSDVRLGLIVNFRDRYLKLKRVLFDKDKKREFVDSHKFVALNRMQGQAMLITVLVLGGSLIAASTIAGYLMLVSIRQSSDIANSAKAIFAADTGIEWNLYRRFIDDRYPAPQMTNNSFFEVTAATSTTKSIGKAGNSFRAFQVNF